jgi:very-short-patch-repair endonuclease
MFLMACSIENMMSPTVAEAKLWPLLEPLGFHRQVIACGKTKNGKEWSYILDFFNSDHMLVVEVDGGYHKKQKGRDRRRDRRLAGEGFKTLRIPNEFVLSCPKCAVTEIQALMK